LTDNFGCKKMQLHEPNILSSIKPRFLCVANTFNALKKDLSKHLPYTLLGVLTSAYLEFNLELFKYIDYETKILSS
jgi:hypothetical protein